MATNTFEAEIQNVYYNIAVEMVEVNLICLEEYKTFTIYNLIFGYDTGGKILLETGDDIILEDGTTLIKE